MITISNMKNVDGTKDIDFDFKGLSSDQKPIDVFGGKEIAMNSLFLEYDTEDFYYYIKGSKSEEVVLDEAYTPTAYSEMYRYENLFDGLGDEIKYCIPDITKDINVNFDGTDYVCSPNIQSSGQGQTLLYYGATADWSEYPFRLEVIDMVGGGLHGQIINAFNETGDEHHIIIKAMSGTESAWYKIGTSAS